MSRVCIILSLQQIERFFALFTVLVVDFCNFNLTRLHFVEVQHANLVLTIKLILDWNHVISDEFQFGNVRV